MPDVAIGRLALADVPALAALMQAEWPQWYGPGGPGDARADLGAWCHGGQALPLAVVARRSGAPVGVAALKPASIDSHAHLAPWAAAGVVRPGQRRQGIGRRLLAALEAEAAAAGFDALYCGTATADALLARAGWAHVADTQQLGQPVRVWRQALAPTLQLPAGRWRLRPFTAGDAPAFAQAVRASAAEVGRWMDWAHAAYSEAEARAWFDACTQARAHGRAQEFGLFAADGALLGGAGLNDLRAPHRTCNLGYWLHSSATGQGAATAATRTLAAFAFEAMGMARVEIIAAVGNLASQAVARRSGAAWEGTARVRLQIGGGAHDAQVFALLRPGAASRSEGSARSTLNAD